MSEFSSNDVNTWLQLSIEKGCSIYAAIHYSLFFDGNYKIVRAYEYTLDSLNLKA